MTSRSSSCSSSSGGKRTAAVLHAATTNKKANVASRVTEHASTPSPPQVFKIWPSGLNRAGHTTVTVKDPTHPLYHFLKSVPPHDHYQHAKIRMGRCMHQVPCLLHETAKFRHGASRWWCPVHQGQYGLKKQLQATAESGIRVCDQAHEPVDLCSVEDIPTLILCQPDDEALFEQEELAFAELGIWMGLPPAINLTSDEEGTRSSDHHKPLKPSNQLFFPGIHVHARKDITGPKLIDTNFPAVTIQDRTGRFPQLADQGVTITSPAALEYLLYMEHKCPVNEQQRQLESPKKQPKLFRSKVELVPEVRCKNCNSLHEDIGDYFGETKHKKHLCGQCGRAIMGQATIGNPLVALEREFRRNVVGGDNARLELSSTSGEYSSITMWPSTPAVFYSRPSPEPWGVHVHAVNAKTGQRVIDDSFGEVWLDGKKLDRAELFQKMVAGIDWLREPDAVKQAATALELEDD